MSSTAAVPLEPPTKKGPKVPVGYRADPDTFDWLKKFVSEDRPIAGVVEWVVGLGRAYFDLAGEFDKRLDEMVDSTGRSRQSLMREALKLGLEALHPKQPKK